MEIIANNLKSQIITDNPKLLKALRDIYTFRVKGANYSPQYRSGRWDGKKSFITASGQFKTGLLSDILEKLTKIECYPDITDNRSVESIDIKNVEGFTYYDYQEALIKQGLVKRGAILKSSTGSGKTLIMAGLIKSLAPRKMVILFHQKQILKQAYDFFIECGLENIGLNFGEGFIYGDIMLSTVQSIEKILDTHLTDAEVLMVDEIHEFSSGGRLEAISSFPNAAYRIGLTATVPKDNIKKYSIMGAIGEVCEYYTTEELIEQGVIAKPTIKVTKINYSTDLQEEKFRDAYHSVYEEFITNNNIRNNEIKSIVQENAIGDNRVAILVQSVEHGNILNKLIPNSEYISGKDSIKDRYKAINKFIAGELSCLIGTNILQTGVNIKELSHIINARGLESDTATLQALGRSLRIKGDKTKAVIYEFDDDIKYLHKHYNARKRHYKGENHTIEIIKEIDYEE